jgi:hypothetical protein
MRRIPIKVIFGHDLASDLVGVMHVGLSAFLFEACALAKTICMSQIQRGKEEIWNAAWKSLMRA